MSHAPRTWPTKKETTKPKQPDNTNRNDRMDAPLRMVSCSFQICNRWIPLRMDADRHDQRPMSSKKRLVNKLPLNFTQRIRKYHRVYDIKFRNLRLNGTSFPSSTCCSKRKLRTPTESSLRTLAPTEYSNSGHDRSKEHPGTLHPGYLPKKNCEQAK